MENRNITTNASRGCGDEVSPDVEEANSSLTKTDTGCGTVVNGSHINNGTSEAVLSEQEQSNSDPGIKEIGVEADQQTAAETTADALDCDETPPDPQVPNLPSMVAPEGDESPSSKDIAETSTADRAASSAGDDDEGEESTTVQEKPCLQDDSRPEDLTNQEITDLRSVEAPEGNGSPSSGDTAETSTADSAASSAGDDDEGEESTTVQEKPCLQDDSRPEDLTNQEITNLRSVEAPEGNGSPSSGDTAETSTAGGPVSSAGHDEEGEESTTVQEKPCLQDDSRPEDLTRKLPMIIMVLVIAVIAGVVHFNGSSTQPDPKEENSVDIFRREFNKMKSSFPSQRAEVWKRSKIHLERHLQTAEPTEPVSMILTSGRGAERTLRCLAGRMAAAFSSALGASVLHIDGAGMATLESDRVKLDIDQQLSGAFEGDGRAAVVHRFEELPPGSTLIFYRYCDHENAAYKGTFLLFTVLLEEDELKSHLALSAVEEMVQYHIQDKFLSSAHPNSFDRMDVDKFSGLWSRISHLTLPVAVEESAERHDCNI